MFNAKEVNNKTVNRTLNRAWFKVVIVLIVIYSLYKCWFTFLFLFNESMFGKLNYVCYLFLVEITRQCIVCGG